MFVFHSEHTQRCSTITCVKLTRLKSTYMKIPKFPLLPVSSVISKADGTINTSESHGERCGSEASESSILFQPKSVWHRVSLGSLRADSILPWGAVSPSSPDSVSNLSVASWSPAGKSMVWRCSRLGLVLSGEFVSSIQAKYFPETRSVEIKNKANCTPLQMPWLVKFLLKSTRKCLQELGIFSGNTQKSIKLQCTLCFPDIWKRKEFSQSKEEKKHKGREAWWIRCSPASYDVKHIQASNQQHFPASFLSSCWA